MRLERAFAAERSFAANAAHELRTPLAGALGQLQRLRHQSQDPETRRRADEVEHTLRRLIRLSEKLMQLARAEGARLLTDAAADIRPVLDMVVRDFAHAASAREIRLDLPDQPVLARVDLDAIAIVARNLIENAIRHGDGGTISVRLDADATLTVENSGPTVPADRMLSLTDRFVRGNSVDDGSGLGLAIVQTIAGRIGSQLVLHSPVPGRADGFQASLSFLPQIPQLTD
ncbi:sensor histidine kinase [Gemmobacter lanyuensis]